MPQVFDQEVKEQGATALWVLGGHTPKQQKHIAELIGYRFVLDLLLSTSDKMQYVGKAAGTGPDRAGLFTIPKSTARLVVSVWGPLVNLQ